MRRRKRTRIWQLTNRPVANFIYRKTELEYFHRNTNFKLNKLDPDSRIGSRIQDTYWLENIKNKNVILWKIAKIYSARWSASKIQHLDQSQNVIDYAYPLWRSQLPPKLPSCKTNSFGNVLTSFATNITQNVTIGGINQKHCCSLRSQYCFVPQFS